MSSLSLPLYFSQLPPFHRHAFLKQHHKTLIESKDLISLLGRIQDQTSLFYALDHPSYPSFSHLSSPIEILLRNLYHFFPHRAQWIARNFIQVNHSFSSIRILNPAEWGLLKTAGKRWQSQNMDPSCFSNEIALQDSSYIFTSTTLPPFPVYISPFSSSIRLLLERSGVHSSSPIPYSPFLFDPSFPNSPFSSLKHALDWLVWKKTLHAQNQKTIHLNKDESEYRLDGKETKERRWIGKYRQVYALLLDENLTPLMWSVNRPDLNRTWHAEWGLLDALYRLFAQDHFVLNQLPSKFYLLSTLKPCKMCAGAWRTYAFPSHLEVHYLEEDQGKNGQNTAFDLGSFACEQADLFWIHQRDQEPQSIFSWLSWSQTSWARPV